MTQMKLLNMKIILVMTMNNDECVDVEAEPLASRGPMNCYYDDDGTDYEHVELTVVFIMIIKYWHDWIGHGKQRAKAL